MTITPLRDIIYRYKNISIYNINVLMMGNHGRNMFKKDTIKSLFDVFIPVDFYQCFFGFGLSFLGADYLGTWIYGLNYPCLIYVEWACFSNILLLFLWSRTLKLILDFAFIRINCPNTTNPEVEWRSSMLPLRDTMVMMTWSLSWFKPET